MKRQTLILSHTSVRKLQSVLVKFLLIHLDPNNSQPLKQPRLQVHQCTEEELLHFLLVGHTTRAYCVKVGHRTLFWTFKTTVEVNVCYFYNQDIPSGTLSQGWGCGNDSSFVSPREYILSSSSVIDRAVAVTRDVDLSQPFPRSGGKGLVPVCSAIQLYQPTVLPKALSLSRKSWQGVTLLLSSLHTLNHIVALEYTLYFHVIACPAHYRSRFPLLLKFK